MPARHFLRAFCMVGLLFWAGASTALFANDRPRAPFKVLYSNDTTNILSCVSPYHKPRQATFTDDMIRASIDEAAAADVHLLQPGMGWIPWWKSKIYPADEHYRQYVLAKKFRPDPFAQYMLAGGDMVKTFLDHCRQKRVAGFISLRMNDAHHLEYAGQGNAVGAHYVSKFYDEHYQRWRIGPDASKTDDRVLNWAIPEVRQQKYDFIREICENYDIDGLELDFMRFPSLFQVEKTTPEERRRIMTDFVASIRQVLDRTAKDGKRRWLCIRVPARLAGLDRLGFDYPALSTAGVDMFNLSCSYFTSQQTDLKAIRNLLPNAAVYLEMTHTPYLGKALPGKYDSFQFLRTTPAQYYTTALMALNDGADGLSLFNFVYTREHGTDGRGPFAEPPFEILPHLLDKTFLASEPQWYFISAAAMPKFMREHDPLPRTFKRGDSAEFSIDMLCNEAHIGDGVLRIMAENPMPDAQWTAKINGEPMRPIPFFKKPLEHPYKDYMGEETQYACFRWPRDAARSGTKLELTLEQGKPAKIVYVELALPTAKSPAPAPMTHVDGEWMELRTTLPKPPFGEPVYLRAPEGLKVESPPVMPPRLLVPKECANLAWKKPVSSSDRDPTIGELTLITDGEKECLEGNYVELRKGVQWVQIDLEHERPLYAILIWRPNYSGRIYHGVVVQVSNDPEFKAGVNTLFNNDDENAAKQGPGKDLHYWETYIGKLIEANGVKARYVRLYSNGNTRDEENHYIEVEVWGLPN